MTTSISADQVQRFSFDNTDLRGVITHLDQAFTEVKSRHNYPQWLLRPLGELMAGAAILGTNLKFAGRLTLQVRMASGPATLLQAEVNDQGSLRAIARYDESVEEDAELALDNGQLIITIEPDQGQRYQGITAIEGGHIAAALQGYFEQSEQLASRFWLHCDGERAAGMMLQKLPTSGSADDEAWERLTIISSTLKAQELYELSFDDVLHRLFHEELLRVFPTQSLAFNCSCSQPRVLAALKGLGQDELLGILEEQGEISTQCEFCLQEYHIDKSDIDKLFGHQSIH